MYELWQLMYVMTRTETGGQSTHAKEAAILPSASADTSPEGNGAPRDTAGILPDAHLYDREFNLPSSGGRTPCTAAKGRSSVSIGKTKARPASNTFGAEWHA
eukprot:6174412-Pleurochrysis_carterae.AAC.5